MKKWVSLLLMVGFCSLAYAHEEKDGLNSVGTYQMQVAIVHDPTDRVGQRIYVMDTRTGGLILCSTEHSLVVLCSSEPLPTIYRPQSAKMGDPSLFYKVPK